MTTQSIQSQSSKLFANIAGSGNGKGKHSGSGFDLFINSSLKTTSDTNTKSQASKNDSVKTNTQQSGAKMKDIDKDDKSIISKTDNPFKQVKNSTDLAKTDDTVTNDVDTTKDDKDDTISDNQQLITQIVGMLQSVQEAAMKALNLSSEELNQLLTKQGMSVTDLLEPEKLQQLVLASKGTNDILNAITDENLADTMKQLLQTVQEMKDSSNLELSADQIKSLLQQAKEQGNSQVSSLMPQEVTENPINIVENQQVKVTENNKADDKGETVSNAQVSNNGLDKNVITQDQKAASDFTGNQSSNHKSKDELNSKDQFQVFVDNLVKASPTIQNNFAGDINQLTQFRDIVNQIVERIKVSVTTTNTTMEMQLNPENLGKINLTVQSKNGVMTAQFLVQNETSKQAIESQMQTLRDTLSQQGVKIEAIEVTVSANAFEQNYNQDSSNQADTRKNDSGKKISLEDALNMTEVMEEVSNTEENTGLTGSQIDYTA